MGSEGNRWDETKPVRADLGYACLMLLRKMEDQLKSVSSTMPQSQRRFKNGRENLHAQPSGQNFLAWGRSCRVAQSIPPADPSATPDKHHLQTDTQHRQVNRADVWSETMQKNKWHQKEPHPPPQKSHFTVLSHSHWSGAEMFYLYTLSGRHLHFICVCVRVSYLRFQFRNFQVELVQMFIHKCDQCLRKHKVTHWSNTEKNKNKKTLRRRMKNKIY